jgi:hypothetical protein
MSGASKKASAEEVKSRLNELRRVAPLRGPAVKNERIEEDVRYLCTELGLSVREIVHASKSRLIRAATSSSEFEMDDETSLLAFGFILDFTRSLEFIDLKNVGVEKPDDVLWVKAAVAYAVNDNYFLKAKDMTSASLVELYGASMYCWGRFKDTSSIDPFSAVLLRIAERRELVDEFRRPRLWLYDSDYDVNEYILGYNRDGTTTFGGRFGLRQRKLEEVFLRYYDVREYKYRIKPTASDCPYRFLNGRLISEEFANAA